jgi:HPt (histidine-containing phosphotransfer) domain-containing protein
VPVETVQIVNDKEEYIESIEQQKTLRLNFIKNNQTVFADIKNAFNADDTKLAHRLVHTLKGSAGLLGKIDLKNAASDVETLLRDGIESVWDNKMNILNTELMLVLEEFKPLLEEALMQEKPQALDTEQTLALFEELIPMLENDNPECVDLLGRIRAVPGSDDLVQLIEDYNFNDAASLAAKIFNNFKEKTREGL